MNLKKWLNQQPLWLIGGVKSSLIFLAIILTFYLLSSLIDSRDAYLSLLWKFFPSISFFEGITGLNLIEEGTFCILGCSHFGTPTLIGFFILIVVSTVVFFLIGSFILRRKAIKQDINFKRNLIKVIKLIVILFLIILFSLYLINITNKTPTCWDSWYKNERDDCYQNIAYKEKDILLCEKVLDENKKNTCIAIIKQDSFFCEKINEYYWKSNCYKDVAILNLNSSLCELSPQNKGDCYSSIAIKITDSTLCDKIQINDIKYRCRALVKEDVFECFEIQDPAWESSCFMLVAAKKQDISICDEWVSTGFLRERCYYDVAISQQDQSICKRMIKDSHLLESCYTGVAISRKDSSLCKDNYFCLAIITRKPSICERTRIDKEKCYMKTSKY